MACGNLLLCLIAQLFSMAAIICVYKCDMFSAVFFGSIHDVNEFHQRMNIVRLHM